MELEPNGLSLKAGISRTVNLFDKKEKAKLLATTAIQVILGFLDLLGVALVGMLAALAIRGFQSQQPGDRVSRILELVGLENSNFRTQIMWIGILAILVLVIKTVLSVYFMRKTITYLSMKSARITSSLTSKLLNQQITYIQKESIQNRIFNLTNGVSNLMVGVMANLILVIADTSLLLVLTAGLFVVDPIISICTLSLFSLIGVMLYVLTHMRASKLSSSYRRITIESNQKLFEVLSSFRELTTRGGLSYSANIIRKQRNELAKYDAELKFLPNISKYVTELAIVLGVVALAGLLLTRADPYRAIGVLAVFITASTRIAPAVMRIQQNFVMVKAYISSARPTLELADELNRANALSQENSRFEFEHLGFTPSITVENLTYTYPDASSPVVKNISLKANPGSFIALVGPSGSGKSTLVDLILGILETSDDSIKISGVDSKSAVHNWPGAIGYVPQEVFLANATVKENVCLGYDPTKIEDADIWSALRAAELEDFISGLPNGLQTMISEGGNNLSGGQKQRLGIARALFTKPKVIIFDEATSSLDPETESKITDSIVKLRGACTVLVIAHRLSTVRLADELLYLSEGEVAASGTFEELKLVNLSFANQAKLMGL
jgi:ABC-type multidrug transport system fused ATPase/permease subunit